MDCRLRCGYDLSASVAGNTERMTMTVQITVPIDDASLERVRSAAAARGMTVEDYVAELVRLRFPSVEHPVKGHVSSIFGLVKDGEPTDIAKDKDKLIGEAAWQEYLEETNQK
jgi:hypothetical protein